MQPMTYPQMNTVMQLNAFYGQPTTIKQQRSQTVQNYIEFLNDFYEDFQPTPNILQHFYPKQVQRHIQKRKHQNSERIVHGLKAPISGCKGEKALKKMQMLTKCQTNFV